MRRLLALPLSAALLIVACDGGVVEQNPPAEIEGHWVAEIEIDSDTTHISTLSTGRYSITRRMLGHATIALTLADDTDIGGWVYGNIEIAETSKFIRETTNLDTGEVERNTIEVDGGRLSGPVSAIYTSPFLNVSTVDVVHSNWRNLEIEFRGRDEGRAALMYCGVRNCTPSRRKVNMVFTRQN